jgi:integral membrane protein (TIGR01906 family)
MIGSIGRGVAAIAIGAAAIVVILAVTIALFFNPIYVGIEQNRAQADAWTGYTPEQVHSVTDSVLAEIYFGPARFEQTVDGAVVFDPRERAHLADVRGVLLGFGAVTLGSVIVLVAGFVLPGRRDWRWRAIRRASGLLAAAVVLGGILFAVAFDAAFDLFHRLFFAGGSYTFDPYTERLVQLFPGRFWTETSIAIAVVALLLSAIVWRWAGRRERAAKVSADSAREGAQSGLPVAAEDAR